MPNFRGARGASYGAAHTQARASAFARLSEYSPCCRCGRLMWKHAKDPQGRSALHYDHNDSRTGYLGFSHRECNVRAGAAKGGRVALALRRGQLQRAAVWQSRRW